MAANTLLIGTASDGAHNKCLQLDITGLGLTYGGGYIERTSLTATATGYILEYIPAGVVIDRNSNGVRNTLYAPTVDGQEIEFGPIGGTGDTVDFEYTPYLGKSDLIAAGSYFLDQAPSVSVCRVGGSKASASYGGWLFEGVYRGAKYNKITVTGGTEGITVSGLEPNFPTRVYGGDAEIIAAQMNEDARLGCLPVYCTYYDETVSAFTTQLTGGTDGTISADTMTELLASDPIPSSVSHVIVLANINQDMLEAVGNALYSNEVQPRLWMFAGPDTLAPVSFVGLDNSATALSSLFGPTAPASGFSSLTISTAGNIINLSTDGTVKLSAVGIYGTGTTTIQGYDAYDMYDAVVGLTGAPSGTVTFTGAGYERPITNAVITTTGVLSVNSLVVSTTPASTGYIDEILACARLLPTRSPYVAAVLGDVITIAEGKPRLRYAAEAVGETISREGVVTNQATRASALIPAYSENEVNLAKLNGFIPLVRFIGSGIAASKGYVTDTETRFIMASKASEISATCSTVTRDYIGSPLKQGRQQQIEEAINTSLVQITNFTVESVSADVIFDRLRVYIEGSIAGEILRISFTARTQ